MSGDKSGKLLVVTGPSGVGKSTITSELIRRTNILFSVSVTTREPRPGEVDGREYRFVSRDEFERLKESGDLLEWAEIFGGHCYGTLRQPIREAVESGRNILLEIDIQGGLQVHEQMPDEYFVLIVPPDRDELMRRLSERGTEGPEALAERLGKAEEELKIARESGIYTHEVVNDDLEKAVQELTGILDGINHRLNG